MTVRLLVVVAAVSAVAPAAAEETPTAAERAADEAAAQLAAAEAPAFDDSVVQPFATQNLRLNLGGGVFSFAGGADDVSVSGAALSAHLHAGDTFFGFFSYYVPVRGTLFLFDEVKSGAQVVNNFNDKQGFAVESGLGLELWPWPEVVCVSAEGVGSLATFETAPVRRADYALSTAFAGVAGRGRATVQFGGLGVFAEYQHHFPMVDLVNQSQWDGYQITAGLTYHMGGRLAF